ncbi:16009_t:CDS:2 [Dentiscutata erythropus]|uniref:16009_t:CDS:1 n=1 Tax=Dentiscutata erythropus TaxID=1348616 RepID=A0A9N8WHH5_9GLOM|nr:16009_t:CDS:2 [Dentiscutata erythropus]
MDGFEDYKFINSGAFSQVYRARFKNANLVKYVLILEYEDNGLCENICTKNSAKIEWALKIKYAIQLVEAVKCLHAHIIIHCDLNMPDDRPSIEEVALVLEDFIVQDITDNDSFDLSDISEFEEFIKNTFGSIKDNNIKLNAMADEMTLFVNNLKRQLNSSGTYAWRVYYKLRRRNNAFYYLKKAIENGNINALNTLGLCYQKGQGTGTSKIEGLNYLKKRQDRDYLLHNMSLEIVKNTV